MDFLGDGRFLGAHRGCQSRTSVSDLPSGVVHLTGDRISAANLLESALVVDRLHDPVASIAFDDLIPRLAFVIEPVTATQIAIAREAYRQFGRGSGYRARLNFGDCFAYALAMDLDEPLLFVGNDFVHTDVRQVLA